MPEIVVYAAEGRSLEEKHGLLRDITEAVVKNFSINREMVTVQIVECPASHKAKGGIPFSVRHPRDIPMPNS